MVGIFNSLDHSIPRNHGAFRRIRVLLRENCCVGIPRHPASCSVATSNLSDRVANVVQAAIAEMAAGHGMAEAGAVIPASMAVVSGRDPRSGKAFVNQILLGFSGGAAAPRADAWQTLMHVGSAGMCFMDGVELDELRQPIVVHARRFVIDTEGAGRTRGASSVEVIYGPEGGPINIVYASDGALNPARGVCGGGDGAPAMQSRIRDGHSEPLPNCGLVRLEPGDLVVARSAGGGGYGAPTTRSMKDIARDVSEGWISPERARQVYGATIDVNGQAVRVVPDGGAASPQSSE
jgi:N-methylhydantoinase B